jgi:hypothetical protein
MFHFVNARFRLVYLALAGIVAVWILALGGYAVSDHFKMTAEKLCAWLAHNDLNAMSADARARALRELADKINALSPDERRRARLDHLWSEWFGEMTDAEKAQFIDATMPTGFHQMLASFEQQPAEKRRRAIDSAIKRLEESRDHAPPSGDATNSASTNGQQVLSPELQKRVMMIGLNSVYSDSTAQTKAELAPLMEEIQRNMENGRMFRGGPGP